MPYVTCTKNIDDMPIYPGVMGAFVPGQSIYVHDSVAHVYVGNPDFTITDEEPALAALGARVDKARLAMIGRVPMTMTGIGNSIMTNSVPWFVHACDMSNGLFVDVDQGWGVGGNTTAQMLARKENVPASADLVVIMECSNDAGFGAPNAEHRANMRALISFYLSRGQIPIVCLPPARSDNALMRNRVAELAMMDYFIAQEFGVPCIDPWRIFTDETTGDLSAAAGSTDSLHPDGTAHKLAGEEMLKQLTGASHTLPLPVANTRFGFALFDNPLFLSLPSDVAGVGTYSLVTSPDIPGNWAKAVGASSGEAYIHLVGAAAVVPGDELLVVYRLKSGGDDGVPIFTSVYLTGSEYAQIGGRYALGEYDGVHAVKGSVIAGTNTLHLSARVGSDPLAVNREFQIAQAQAYNKTALLNR